MQALRESMGHIALRCGQLSSKHLEKTARRWGSSSGSCFTQIAALIPSHPR